MDHVALATPGSAPLNFSYGQLGTDTSIRLLHLDHVGPIATITCTLQEFELAECPPYVAVSYCWGAPNSTQQILINGVVATITQSLAAVLRQLQADGREDEYFVWADAICINQHAVHELDAQIKLMPRIYGRALRVIAWLSKIGADMNDLRNIKSFVEGGLKMPKDQEKAKMVDNRLYRAFLALSKLDYWRRMWVVQEVSLANDIELCCSSVRVRWGHFFAALSEVLGERYASHGGVRQSMNIFVTSSTRPLSELDALRQRIRSREKLPLLKAMYWTRDCEARFVRDKIFALLGLVTDSWQPSQALFYGHKLEFVEKQITLYEMQSQSQAIATLHSTANTGSQNGGSESSYSLDLITFSNINSQGDGGRQWLPSWTNRSLWARLRMWQYLKLDRPGDSRFQAMPRLDSIPARSEAGALRVRGICLGMVSGPRDVGPWIYRDRSALLTAARELEHELRPNTPRRHSLLHWYVLDPDGIAADRGVKMDLAMHRKRLEDLVKYLERVSEDDKAEQEGRSHVRRRSQFLNNHGSSIFRSARNSTNGGRNDESINANASQNGRSSQNPTITDRHDDNSTPTSPNSLKPDPSPLVRAYKRQLRDFLLLGSSNAAAGAAGAAGDTAGSTWGFGLMKLVRTSRGLLGFGPAGQAAAAATPLDLVYLLHGCSVPLVLRRSGSGISDNGHVIVGEMLGLGVMYGEFWKRRKEKTTGTQKGDGEGEEEGNGDEKEEGMNDSEESLFADGWLDSLGPEEDLELL